MNGFPAFSRYIGVDYSGAETPLSSLKGLRVYTADRASLPFEVTPPPGLRKYWSRRGIAEWLTASLSEEAPTLVGIDHGFSFPLQYFQENNLPLNWMAFWTIFNVTGLQMKTSMLTSSAKEFAAKERCEAETERGVG
jgi:hypothetical protein